MAPSNDSIGCLASTAHFFSELFHKLRDCFRSNNNASVQPGEDTTSSNGSSQEQNSSRPRSRNTQDGNRSSMASLEMGKRSDLGGGSKQEVAEASIKLMSRKTREQSVFTKPDWEDEDVCPTCLEEYDNENPKIITKCFHHFHLGCIYEWKERSDRCPVCYRVMVFEETA